MEEEKHIHGAGKNQKLMPLYCCADKVASNNDLLTDILLRLPVRSLLRSKAVSKHWYPLIANPNFRREFCNRNSNILNPSGLFLPLAPCNGTHVFGYEFVPLDTENPIEKPPFRTLKLEELDRPQSEINLGPLPPNTDVEIVQSSNGLLLCRYCRMLPGPFNSCSLFPYTSDAHFHKYFIYNPTTKEFATIEVPKRKFGISLAFDPRKSPHYRVVCLLYQYCGCWLEIYSSETQTWKASAKTFTSEYEFWFSCGVYWNDGLHWVDKRFGLWYLKLDEESLHETQVPLMPDGVEFWERHSNHLVESFDCLLYVDTFFPHPEKFNVYEMKRDYSGWTVKYKVDLGEPGELQPLFLYQFLIHTLVLGQREEDSFLVFQMPGQVIRYNLVSKTFQKLCDLASGVLTCFDMKQIASIKTAPMEGFLFIESLFPVSNVTS